MTSGFIFKCKQLNEGVLIFSCLKSWSQDDIEQLVELFLHQYAGFEAIEQLTGADRVSVRLLWRQCYVQLHFECYSESIWMEAEQVQSQQQLQQLFTELDGQ